MMARAGLLAILLILASGSTIAAETPQTAPPEKATPTKPPEKAAPTKPSEKVVPATPPEKAAPTTLPEKAVPATPAAPQPPKADLLEGQWQGSWSSSSTGMDGSLQCTMRKLEDGTYSAAFSAIFGMIFTHKSTVTLHAEVDGDIWRFRGQEDLGFFSGGVYTYEGRTDGEEFYSTYDSLLDKGIFQMKRVKEPIPPATEPSATSDR